MHVKTKKLAIAGVTLALAMVFVLLATLINWNSLFFYIIGGFLIGAVIRLCEMKMAAGYFAASSVLGFFLAGDKVEIFTFIFAKSFFTKIIIFQSILNGIQYIFIYIFIS